MQIFVGRSRVKLDRMMGELGCHGFVASIQIVQYLHLINIMKNETYCVNKIKYTHVYLSVWGEI